MSEERKRTPSPTQRTDSSFVRKPDGEFLLKDEKMFSECNSVVASILQNAIYFLVLSVYVDST